MRDGIAVAVRITPLTDHDVAETVATAGLPPGCRELLGRVSQLIEELPWLQGLEATLESTEAAGGAARTVLGSDVRIGFLPVPAVR